MRKGSGRKRFWRRDEKGAGLGESGLGSGLSCELFRFERRIAGVRSVSSTAMGMRAWWGFRQIATAARMPAMHRARVREWVRKGIAAARI